VGKTVDICSFVTWFIQLKETNQSYRNWRQTDDGCEELDGNPSSGHVLTGEILAEHDGDEVGWRRFEGPVTKQC